MPPGRARCCRAAVACPAELRPAGRCCACGSRPWPCTHVGHGPTCSAACSAVTHAPRAAGVKIE
eukprot:3852869-Prymnesium_polylepis.1